MSTKSTEQTKTAETFELKTANHTYSVPVKYKACTSVSQVIRAMAKDGHSTANIAKQTGIRYQHVRNVLTAPVKNG